MTSAIPGSSSQRGFTLVEMIISMIIGGVIALAAGSMIIFSQKAWLRAQSSSDLKGDMLAAQRKFEFELRGATTEPPVSGWNTASWPSHGVGWDTYNMVFPVMAVARVPFTSGWGSPSDPYVCSTSPDQVVFHTVKVVGGVRRFVRGRFRLTAGNEIVYDSWTGSTSGGGSISYPGYPSANNRQVVLRNVTNASFSLNLPGLGNVSNSTPANSAVGIDITVTRPNTFGGSADIEEHMRLVIQSRMKKRTGN